MSLANEADILQLFTAVEGVLQNITSNNQGLLPLPELLRKIKWGLFTQHMQLAVKWAMGMSQTHELATFLAGNQPCRAKLVECFELAGKMTCASSALGSLMEAKDTVLSMLQDTLKDKSVADVGGNIVDWSMGIYKNAVKDDKPKEAKVKKTVGKPRRSSRLRTTQQK